MKIKHDIFSVELEKPLLRLRLYIPGFKFSYKETYDEIDFEIKLPTLIEASKYEYGYTFTLKVLGFGFDIWVGRNL